MSKHKQRMNKLLLKIQKLSTVELLKMKEAIELSCGSVEDKKFILDQIEYKLSNKSIDIDNSLVEYGDTKFDEE